MVKSKLDSSINYPEIRKLNYDDKNYEASLYEATIFEKSIIIALGQEKYSFMDKNVIYFPVYLVKDDKVTTQIGVYEINANNQPGILDEEGDIDIDKLGPLLSYSFLTNKLILTDSQSVVGVEPEVEPNVEPEVEPEVEPNVEP